jgi:hypothetical protein
MSSGYKQQVKDKSRRLLWSHAVKSLTAQRTKNQILNERYVRRLWNYCFKERLFKFTSISSANAKILDDWILFAQQCYGAKTPAELRIAYLCGPEPENDLKVLLELGIRIENVWAFENDNQLFKNAISSIKDNYPTLKIFNGRIDTFLSISPAKFDIIYLDFTGPLFSPSSKPYQAIHSVFDHQSLSELGVLIVNSCLPEKTDESIDFLSSYYFNQQFLESTVLSDHPELDHDGSYGEGADAYGFSKSQIKRIIEKNFWFAYSAFATHYPIFYANLIQPAHHVLKNPLVKKRLFEIKEEALDEIDQKYFNREEIILEWTEYAFYNFLQSLGDYRSAREWSKYFNSNAHGASRDSAVRYVYMLRDAVYGDFVHLLSDSLKKSISEINNSIPDIKGGRFCDVPMIHLWLELAVNQLGYPNHTNIKNHKRFSYKAKENEMFVDVFTFDKCRALYDWLPMIEYYGKDLSNIERQMITRICMDAIGKHRLYILDALYFGSALICINDKAWSKNHEFKKRIKLF